MKQLDPGASPQEWFGNELRKLRLEQGLSAKELGRLVQVSDDMILSIEKGKYPSCRRDVVQRLDDVLGTGGLLDRAWPMVFGNRDAEKRRADADKASTCKRERPAQAPAGSILVKDEPTFRPGSHEPVIRRSFLQIGGLAAIAPINLTDVFAPSELFLPTAVNPSHIDQVLAAATAVSGMDNELGAAAWCVT
ncbi:helix-turn-helix domain-containing protein [Streptomyces sp. WG7]|uniref:helix-turn-helix domain-containing protein n=1 Tax=Streptomyces sp. WG7 TaxID=3417650 RepID=UPI003CE6989C